MTLSFQKTFKVHKILFKYLNGHIKFYLNIRSWSGNPPLFDLKIVYSYVIEVADSESDLGLHGRALV